MEMTLSVTDEGPVLRGAFDGVLSVGGLHKAMLELREAAVESGHQLLLADMRKVGAPLTDYDRYAIGKNAAGIIRSHMRVAVIYPAELITHLSENVAVNRGVDLGVFGTEEEAMAWLLAHT